MNKENIVRIKKVEKFNGTYYFPQKRVWKSRWFSESGYEWEYFFLVSARGFGDVFFRNTFVSYSQVQFESKILEAYKNLEKADYDCKEYLRVYHGDEVIKTFSTEENTNE